MENLSLDAPVEGWNAFNSLDNMPPTAAVIMNNLIPGAGSVSTRRGYFVYNTVPTSARVETVSAYNPAPSDQSKLLAAAGGGWWEVESSVVSAPTEIKPVATFTNNRWMGDMFTKADETGVLILCNGVDTTQIYNGTTMVDIDTTGTDPGLSLTPDFIGAIAFKGRMYYWKDNDNAFYYTQAGSYQGEFRKFDLGSFIQAGGKLVSMISWTQQDAGEGRDDFLVFVFSTGEVLVYQGDDPDTAGYWEQVGRYRTAEPLSIRGYVNYGADAILMTKDGYISMASIIQQGRTSDVEQFSRLIHEAVVDRTRRNAHLYGWEVDNYQRDGLLIFNVPISETSYEQHVMNTVTKRWCRFRGLQVNCMTVHDEGLYGGAEGGEIWSMLQGTSDNGEPIIFDCLYAFNYYDAPGVQKHVTMAQVSSTHTRPEDIDISAWPDFQIPDLGPIPLPSPVEGAVWSIDPPVPASAVGSYWDEEYWSVQDQQFTTKGWQNVSGLGFAVGILVRFSKLNESVVWRSTNVMLNKIGAN